MIYMNKYSIWEMVWIKLKELKQGNKVYSIDHDKKDIYELCNKLMEDDSEV